MLLNYRNPTFWKDFHTKYWLPRVPTVIRQPLKDFPFTEDILLRAMKGFEAGLRAGDCRKHCLVSVGDKEIAPRRPLKQIFQEKTESLERLEKAADRVFSKKNFGLMITNMHATDPGIWNPVAAFLQDARHCIDFPVPRAFMDLFYGRYSSNFTGLHKDTQEIFAFVVRGKKRMLAWPFDYFLSKVKGLSAGDRYFNKRLSVDYRKYRKDAIVLDAEAGDIIHWPSDYWHVAETRSEDFSAMVSLGVVRQEGIFSGSGPSPFKKKLLASPKLEALPSQDMSDVAFKIGDAGQLRWATGFGFEIGGPMAEIQRGKSPESITVVKNKSSVILWQINQEKQQVLIASGGHSISFSYSSEIIGLLEKISQAKPVSVSKSSKRNDSNISETYWSNQGEPKVRKLTKRDPLLWLIDWLLRVYAVKRN